MYNLNEIIVNIRCKWAHHLLRMNDTRIPQASVWTDSDRQKKCKLTKKKDAQTPWRRNKPHPAVDDELHCTL
jgi:hypothetical protein